MNPSGLRSLIYHLRNIDRRALPETLLQHFSATRAFASLRYPRGVLYSRVLPAGSLRQSVVPELNRWVEEGNKVRIQDFDWIIRELRRRKRFNDALEVSQWMSKSGLQNSTPAYHAVQLDLIGKVHGLNAAENYFNELSEENKTEKTYGALLNCYTREQSVEKCTSHMEKMKELGFRSGALNYNCLMCLYTNISQYEKVLAVFTDMKENGALPDIFSYKICLNSYGAMSDLKGMEKLLDEMEHQPQITMEWNSYAVVANFYIKARLVEKAIATLKKSEEKLEKGNRLGYNYLISLYGKLGNKTEMLRIWELLKLNCKKLLNRDYLTLLGSLVKLGEFDGAETVLREWESSGNTWDAHLPNVLLIGYCQKGLPEKAEEMVEDMIKKGKDLIPNSWGIVSAGYLDKHEMGKAVDSMKKALLLHAEHERWQPKPIVVRRLLGWLGDEGEVDSVEVFVGLLKSVIPMNREMYHALIKANICHGREVDGLLESMRADNIEEDEETKKILSKRDAT